MAFFHKYTGSSFIALLKAEYPELLPHYQDISAPSMAATSTTIAALKYNDGVLIAGDKRAVVDGHLVVSDDVVKVFRTDAYSALAIAGIFGPSIKLARLFQTELEHYEKMEGFSLSLEGKANKLSQMIEEHFPAAIKGLPVMPIFAGYDLAKGEARIYEYDITGGTFVKPQKEPFSASGSGGERARSTLEHFYKGTITQNGALRLIKKALNFAAKRDVATGGKAFIIKDISAQGVIDII